MEPEYLKILSLIVVRLNAYWLLDYIVPLALELNFAVDSLLLTILGLDG